MEEEKPKEPTVNLTYSQLKDIMIGVVQEMKKPSEEEAKAAAQKKADLERIAREKRELVMADQEAKKQRESRCAHVKPNGQSTIQGQVHSDGKRHPVCFRCGKEFPPQEVSPDQIMYTQ